MIPVLVSLMHQLLETAIIREAFDQGAKDAKDMTRDAKEATRIESERWEKERNAMEVAPKDKVLKTEVIITYFPPVSALMTRFRTTESG